jgi:hypothetical protein
MVRRVERKSYEDCIIIHTSASREVVAFCCGRR